MAKGVIISAEERAKVIEEKANNPFMSAQQIADKLGLTERTVSRIIKEEMASVGEKSKVIADIIDRHDKILLAVDKRILKAVEDKDKEISLWDLVKVKDSVSKQNQLLTGQATDNIGIKSLDKIISEIIDND